MIVEKLYIELCFNDIKLMLFWNGVNVINNLSCSLIVYPITAIPLEFSYLGNEAQFTILYQGGHNILQIKFPDISLIFL